MSVRCDVRRGVVIALFVDLPRCELRSHGVITSSFSRIPTSCEICRMYSGCATKQTPDTLLRAIEYGSDITIKSSCGMRAQTSDKARDRDTPVEHFSHAHNFGRGHPTYCTSEERSYVVTHNNPQPKKIQRGYPSNWFRVLSGIK